jgi:hypothetical protein
MPAPFNRKSASKLLIGSCQPRSDALDPSCLPLGRIRPLTAILRYPIKYCVLRGQVVNQRMLLNAAYCP